MADKGITTKRALIDKANGSLVVVAGIAAFLTVFCLVASKTLISQAGYQNRVLKAKHAAVAQLRSDITAGNQLQTSYQAFTTTTQNAIGGDPNGSGEKDGDNAKIILDALPSNYDFPALATSLEKLIQEANGLKIANITGTDDEAAQSSNSTSATPQPVPMPFQVGVEGNYQAVQSLVTELEHSIRPFQIMTVTISGDQSDLTMTLTAQTYYQPAKSLNISTKVVK
jgi:hypothetical protein